MLSSGRQPKSLKASGFTLASLDFGLRAAPIKIYENADPRCLSLLKLHYASIFHRVVRIPDGSRMCPHDPPRQGACQFGNAAFKKLRIYDALLSVDALQASRRQRLSRAMVRSTIQRLGRTTNPLA